MDRTDPFCKPSELRDLLDWPAPESELHAYLDAVTGAVDLAGKGRVVDGHAYLLAGAMQAEAVGRGESWGEALLRRYVEAIESYRAQFSVRLS
jgi:hypothetical protein